jgi:hypothetical protein
MDDNLIKLALTSKSSTKNNSLALSQEKWANDLIVRFGSAENIVSLFCAKNQYLCEQNLKNTYLGASPTLIRLRLAYGQGVAEAWLMGQIQDLYVFESVNYEDKQTVGQIEQTARAILTNYSYLNMAEVMLFFSRFKGGRYGKPYGNLSGREISSAINLFLKEREVEILALENEIKAKKLKERVEYEKKYAISFEEWEKLKEERNKNNKDGGNLPQKI